MQLFSEYLENFHLLDVGKYFKRPTWGPGEGVNLSIGQPTFDVPLQIRHRAADQILNGPGGYVSSYGIPKLQSKIVKHYATRHGQSISNKQVAVFPGASQALFIAMRVLLSPGDEVVIFDPYFPGYKACAELLGAKVVTVDTFPTFIPGVEDVERVMTPKTKLIIVNSPNNPTGRVYPGAVLQGIADVARVYGAIVISDEVYEDFVYDVEAIPMMRYGDNVITLKSFSKSHAMTGWRVGYAIGSEEIVRKMALVSQYLFACVPPFIQEAASLALDIDPTPFVRAFKEKRDILYEGLKDHFEITKPDGAYYMMIKAPVSEDRFIDQLLEKKISVFPGRMFSEKEGFIRASFVAENDELRKAVQLMQQLSHK